jgi:16S rRNA processing protein RimM
VTRPPQLSDTAVVSGPELSSPNLSATRLSSDEQKWVAVARILRPRGNKGEVAAELLTDFPERLKKIDAVYLGEGGSEIKNAPRRVGVKNFWVNQSHRGQGVFHFAGCDSISQAEKLRGIEVLLPRGQRVKLPAGQYFVSDLVGCSVFENFADNFPGPPAVSSSPCSLATAPALLGTVSDVQFTGEGVSGTPLLAVDTHSGEMLIPLAEDICKRIDVAARRIDVVLPEGLRDLHRE